MAVRITQNGIDLIKDGVVTASKIQDSSLNPIKYPSGTHIRTTRLLSTTRTSFTIPAQNYGNCPGMSLDVTPALSNSKFLIRVRFFGELDNSWDTMWNITRNGTRINQLDNAYYSGLAAPVQTYGAADNNSSTPEIMDFMTLDETAGTVAGNTINYKLVASANSSARTCYVNCDWGNNPSDGNEIGFSEIIVTEIKV